MSKFFYLILILIYCLNVSAQNIIVDYSVKINKEGRASIDDALETLVFKLFANQTESLFKIEESLQMKDELKYQLARAIIVDGYNEYYINKIDKKTIIKKQLAGNLFLIESSLSNYNWKITKETKTINNLTCFKATRIEQQILNKNKQKVDVEITAWFCPKLNFSFGPIGNHGLPGLILQLNIGNKIVYYAEKIEFRNNGTPIEKPNKGDKVSEEEFEKIVRGIVDK